MADVWIRQSVGDGGVNNLDDVTRIQFGLNRFIEANVLDVLKGPTNAMGPFVGFGAVGPELIFAIREFQRKIVGLSRVDGKVDPGGPTLRALNGPITGKAAKASPTTGGKAPWPPKDYFVGHYVGNGNQTWWSVANAFGIRNPWDLIIFNFETEDPKQVNAYLKEYVGCTNRTGVNYVFEGADPGVIYVPPPSWKPSEKYRKGSARRSYAGELAHQVTSILRRAARVCPIITGSGYTITNVDLFTIANLIDADHIKCWIAPELMIRIRPAEYDPISNEFYYSRRPRAGSADDLGIVTHEAVHAAFDARKIKGMSVYYHEYLAFAVQGIIVARLFPKEVERRLKSGPNATLYYAPFLVGWSVASQRHFVDLDDLSWFPNYYDPFQGKEVALRDMMDKFVKARYASWDQGATNDGIA